MKYLILILSTFLFACGDGPSTGNTPEEMFKKLIQSPIPKSITNLEGTGDTWQGYSLYIRFNASSEDIEKIIQKGYSKIKWSEISYRYEIPKSYDIFTPKWKPDSVSTKECYEAAINNSWTHHGTHYLLIDRSKNLIYMYAIGA